MNRRPGYSKEVRERAVRLVLDVERATLTWFDWFNNRRLLRPIGDVPPAEFEMMYYQQTESSNVA
jgi:putative transposase